MKSNTVFKMLGLLLVALLTFGAVANAQTTYYVNNQTGLDGYNGLSPTVTGAPGVGPKLTIANAIAAAVAGDIISVANTGVAYGNLNTGIALTFTSTGGSPVVANITIGAATTFTAGFTLAGTGTLTLTTGAVTNANNITINSAGTIARAAGTLDVAPAFAGTVNVTYSAASKTIGPELPTSTSALNNLTASGAFTVTVNRDITVNGTLTVDNAGGVLALGSNTLNFANAAARTHTNVGNITSAGIGSGGLGIVMSGGDVTFNPGTGRLPNLTVSFTGATVRTLTINGPAGIDGNVTVNSGTVALATPTGGTGITGSLTNNGAQTVTVTLAMTIGGNVSNTSTGVITFAAVNITVTGNVSNTGALSNSSNTVQIPNAANINFGDGVITIVGTVTNSTSFAGTTNSTAAVNAGGFLTSGNITFASVANAVTITGLVTNSSTSTFTLTGAAPDATVLSGNGRITFANAGGNVTFTGGVTNSSSGFSFATAGIGNGTIFFSARAAGTVTVGTGPANQNVTNSSTNTGGILNGNIDFTAAATGAVTVNGNVSLDASAGTGDIILGGAGTGATSVTGSVSNARTVAGGVITFTNTTTSVSVGSLSQTGAGSITFASTTGTLTVTTGGNVTISAGTISTAATTGGITVNGPYTQTGGSFLAASVGAVAPLAIVSSTDATPIVVTTGAHGLASGNVVTIAGHLVNTNANGTFTITFISATTFSLNGSVATGGGAGAATGNVTSGTSTLSITGAMSISGGTFNHGATSNGGSDISVSGDFSFTGGTLTLGTGPKNFNLTGATTAISAGTTVTGGTNTVLVFNRAASAQTLTSGAGVTWPGFLNINNTFPTAPTWTLQGANFIVGGNVTFSAGGAVNGVNLGNFTLFVRGVQAVPPANFLNSSGYTGGANGYVSMGGAVAQTVDGAANFFNIDVDNAAGVTFTNFAGTVATYTVTGTFNLTNGAVAVGTADVIAFNNATTTPTIVRNAGSFGVAPTFTSDVNVTYIGASKAFSNEVPVGGSNKLVNLTIATTGASTITANIDFEFKGTLTINTGQIFAIGAQIVTANGASIVSNGTWTAGTGRVVLNRATGTAITATGALPEIRVAAGSSGNSITGSTGISVGTNPDLTLPGGTGAITLSFTGAGPHVRDIITANALNTITLASNVIASGNLTHGAGSIVLGAFNLSVAGAAPSIGAAGATITGAGTLIFNRVGNQTFAVTGSPTIAANVQMNLDALATTLTITTSALTITGNVTLTRGELIPGTGLNVNGTTLTLAASTATVVTGGGVVTFAPAASTTLTVNLSGATTFNNLTVNGNVTLAGTAGTLTVTATLTHTSGLLDFGARDISAGTFTRTGGTYSATSGYLIVTTALTQGTGFSIPNLRISGSFTVGTAAGFTVTSNLDLNNATLTHTFGGVARLSLGTVGGSVPTITVTTGGLLDVAPTFAQGQANYVFRGIGRTVSAFYWPTTPTTLANNVTVNNNAAVNIVSSTDATPIVITSATHGLATGDIVTISGHLVNTNANGTFGVTVVNATTLSLDGSTATGAGVGAATGTVSHARRIGASRTINGNVTLTQGVLDVATGVTATLASGVTITRTNVGSITLTGTGALSAANVNLTYTTGAVGNTGPEYSSPTVVNNLTVSSPATVTLNSSRTISGTATINGNTTIAAAVTTTIAGSISIATGVTLTITGTLIPQGDLTLTGTGTIAGAGSVTFTGSSNQAVTLAAATPIPNVTINKTSATNTVTVAGGDLTVGTLLTLTNGLMVTGTNNVILTANPGFTRAGVTGTNVSHVIGNVQRAIPFGAGGIGRYEYPVGSTTRYRPYVIVFPSNVITASSITVSHVNVNPGGVLGLPVLDPSTGKRIGAYPDFYWLVRSTISFGASQAFDVELVGQDLGRPFTTVDDLRIIRRFDGAADVNPWSLQGLGANYSNILEVVAGDSIVTVRNTNSTGGIVTQGARFSIGIPTRRPAFTFGPTTATVNENAALRLAYYADPLDVGESITYSLTTSPTIATNAPAIAKKSTAPVDSGIVTWTPNFTQAGSYTLTVSVTDGEFTTTRTTTVTVVNVNRKPTFTAIAAQTIKDKQTLSLALAATDPDGDALTYSFVSIAPAATANPAVTAAGALTWTPVFADAGKVFTIRVAVTDNVATGAGDVPGRDSSNISVTVNRSVIRGDVSGDGNIFAFDAALVLQHVTGIAVLTDPAALFAADASTLGGITAFDAALILQHVAGLYVIPPSAAPDDGSSLGKGVGGASMNAATRGSVAWTSPAVGKSPELLNMSLRLSSEASGIYAVEYRGAIDSRVSIENVVAKLPEGWQMVHNVVDGELRIAMAGISPISAGDIATVVLRLKDRESRFSFAGSAVLNENVQAVETVELAAVPTVFALEQNYPNPFNPSTTIKYQLPENARVSLVVYNLQGQKIRTLVSEDQQAGYYKVQWDGRSQAGESVATGLYIYRVQAGSFVASHKMLLMK